jgi:endoglycosylceramidase
MYQHVANAIREVDSTHILFLEHAYFSNAGVSSGIIPVLGKNRSKDPLVAYAAHGYDLLVDSKCNDNQSCARVAWIFSQINETSKRINVPVLVGEWGAFGGNSEGAAVSAQFIKEQFDNYHFGNTYWAYYAGIEKQLYFKKTFGHPSPQYFGGILKSNSFSPETNTLTCLWEESPSVQLPTVIYIPDLRNLIKESIKVSPNGNNTVIRSAENSNHGYLIIPVSGKTVERKLEFKLSKDHSSISIDGNYDYDQL